MLGVATSEAAVTDFAANIYKKISSLSEPLRDQSKGTHVAEHIGQVSDSALVGQQNVEGLAKNRELKVLLLDLFGSIFGDGGKDIRFFIMGMTIRGGRSCDFGERCQRLAMLEASSEDLESPRLLQRWLQVKLVKCPWEEVEAGASTFLACGPAKAATTAAEPESPRPSRETGVFDRFRQDAITAIYSAQVRKGITREALKRFIATSPKPVSDTPGSGSLPFSENARLLFDTANVRDDRLAESGGAKMLAGLGLSGSALQEAVSEAAPGAELRRDGMKRRGRSRSVAAAMQPADVPRGQHLGHQSDSSPPSGQGTEGEGADESSESDMTLDEVATDLTQMALDGLLDPVVGWERGPGGTESPAKKGRTQEQTLTLSMLRSVLAEEWERDREHLASSLAGVKHDVMNMQGRVQEVENIVQQQVQDTVRALDRVTRRYDKQAGALEEVKAAQFQLEARLQSLEQKPPSTAPGSTADTEGGRRPALIIGGWHPDQAAEDTLKAAREVLRSLDVPLNGDELFVPGLRRGYAILPITPKPFEDEDARRARIQGAIQKVRNANVMLGKNEAGGMRKLWIAISQSPERRKRAKLAGKVKRMILEMGGVVRDMEVEFATGTVWYQHQKVSSATAEKPQVAETAGVGWVDVKHIAKLLRKSLAEVEATWGDRKAELL
ncbi:hypothetical protein AK812_SmicGene35505 [Symbiodinium microadriaticum]|uniref:Uncharacterized protein n=1 Tax=Symbiodinium microadriaticum TaxID=2951 RepID=A0A1Q9CL97_SYMMI|nr:hypothetical protein AK812_SmicGene35505 [Symbiodinium microadriaticum]